MTRNSYLKIRPVFPLVPMLRVGMPSATLRVGPAWPKRGRRASRTAPSRGPWERVNSVLGRPLRIIEILPVTFPRFRGRLASIGKPPPGAWLRSGNRPRGLLASFGWDGRWLRSGEDACHCPDRCGRAGRRTTVQDRVVKEPEARGPSTSSIGGREASRESGTRGSSGPYRRRTPPPNSFTRHQIRRLGLDPAFLTGRQLPCSVPGKLGHDPAYGRRPFRHPPSALPRPHHPYAVGGP